MVFNRNKQMFPNITVHWIGYSSKDQSKVTTTVMLTRTLEHPHTPNSKLMKFIKTIDLCNHFNKSFFEKYTWYTLLKGTTKT